MSFNPQFPSFIFMSPFPQADQSCHSRRANKLHAPDSCGLVRDQVTKSGMKKK